MHVPRAASLQRRGPDVTDLQQEWTHAVFAYLICPQNHIINVHEIDAAKNLAASFPQSHFFA